MSESDTHDIQHFWMISLADLLGIILSFFVLTFSISEMNADGWKQVKNSMGDVFVEPINGVILDQRIKRVSGNDSKQTITDLSYFKKVLLQQINDDPALQAFTVKEEKGHLAVTVPLTALFKPDQSELSVEGISLIFYLGNMLYSVNNKLECRIEIPNPSLVDHVFQKQWQSSFIRAKQLAEELKKSGYSYNIPIFGRVVEQDAAVAEVQKPAHDGPAIAILIHPVKAI
ncbi:MAG: hypothetical protein IPP74_05315 [Alphaproteobacteria bacterium]|nr:hypothetical protein [Alphaproteobacteria bacterium]